MKYLLISILFVLFNCTHTTQPVHQPRESQQTFPSLPPIEPKWYKYGDTATYYCKGFGINWIEDCLIVMESDQVYRCVNKDFKKDCPKNDASFGVYLKGDMK